MVDRVAGVIAEARRARESVAQGATEVSLGRLCAVQAVEYTQMAEELLTLRMGVAGLIPETLRRPLKSLIRRGTAPGSRLAPLGQVLQRFVPPRVRALLKKMTS